MSSSSAISSRASTARRSRASRHTASSTSSFAMSRMRGSRRTPGLHCTGVSPTGSRSVAPRSSSRSALTTSIMPPRCSESSTAQYRWSLRKEAAAALEVAGRRALSREANRSGRKLLLRAVELEPTLQRRFQAARAAWRLADLPAVSREMERVAAEAAAAGESRHRGRRADRPRRGDAVSRRRPPSRAGARRAGPFRARAGRPLPHAHGLRQDRPLAG